MEFVGGQIDKNSIHMKTITVLLMLITTAATAQHVYLRIYQVTRSSNLKDRGEINFDFGVKYDSSKVYAKAVASNNLVAALEFAEGKGWQCHNLCRA